MHCTATTPAAIAPPAARPARAGGSLGSHAAIAALAALVNGFIAHDRNPDLIATGLTAAVTFVGALFALVALAFVFRVVLLLVKIAVPAVALVLLGCALDWPWAEAAGAWLRGVVSEGLAVSAQALAAWKSH